jgi:hypothetical protein
MMTKRHQIETELVILLVLAAGIGVTFAFYYGRITQSPTKMRLPIAQLLESPTPTPTPTPLIPQPQVTFQISPDGTKRLTMTVTTNKDLTKTYTFVTSDADGNNQHTVYTATDTTGSMGIPFNTWSPDNMYVFLTHTTSSSTEALVMKADGQPLTDTEPYFTITAFFSAKNTGNIYQETTGWASETLLIVNTTLQDGSKGPSYWLEIPSKALIQLSSQF